jgi:hypothetical protein
MATLPLSVWIPRANIAAPSEAVALRVGLRAAARARCFGARAGLRKKRAPAACQPYQKAKAGSFEAARLPTPNPLPGHPGQGEGSGRALAHRKPLGRADFSFQGLQLRIAIGCPLTRHRTVWRSVCGGGLPGYTRRRGLLNHWSGRRGLSRGGRSGGQRWRFEAAGANNSRAQTERKHESK